MAKSIHIVVIFNYPNTLVSILTGMRVLLIAASMLSLTGCIPAPHRHYFAPKISGSVNADGIAVPRAEVRLSAHGTQEVVQTLTETQGNFAIGPLTEIQLTRGVIGDPGYFFVLTIKADGREYLGYDQGIIGYSPETLNLTCDLARPIKWGEQIRYCAYNNRLQPDAPNAARP
jgi:hypothetical protein